MCASLCCSDVGAMKGRRGADPNSRTLMSYNIWNYNADWQERKRLIAQFVRTLRLGRFGCVRVERRLTRAGEQPQRFPCVRAD